MNRVIFGIPAKLWLRILGIVLIIVGWHIVSIAFSGLVVASPAKTISAATRLLSDVNFIQQHFMVSLKRMGIALGLGVILGGGLGMLSGVIPGLRLLIDPLRWIFMTIPGIVILVVFMLWFGTGSLMVILIAASMSAPIIFVNVSNAMLLADQTLIEMADVYQFGLRRKLINIYTMAVAGPFFSSLVIAAGHSIRVVVLAELLGANEGIGYCLAIARTNLDTPSIYALAIISMSIVGGIEFFLLRPLKNRFVWRE